MILFGNKDIIPDDIAENIAQNLFVVYNRGLEFNIDEDISRYEAYVDIKLKPFWHYCSGDISRITMCWDNGFVTFKIRFTS